VSGATISFGVCIPWFVVLTGFTSIMKLPFLRSAQTDTYDDTGIPLASDTTLNDRDAHLAGPRVEQDPPLGRWEAPLGLVATSTRNSMEMTQVGSDRNIALL